MPAQLVALFGAGIASFLARASCPAPGVPRHHRRRKRGCPRSGARGARDLRVRTRLRRGVRELGRGCRSPRFVAARLPERSRARRRRGRRDHGSRAARRAPRPVRPRTSPRSASSWWIDGIVPTVRRRRRVRCRVEPMRRTPPRRRAHGGRPERASGPRCVAAALVRVRNRRSVPPRCPRPRVVAGDRRAPPACRADHRARREVCCSSCSAFCSRPARIRTSPRISRFTPAIGGL